MRLLGLLGALWATASLADGPTRGPIPLILKIVSTREARTSVPARYGASPAVTEWTVVTATANARPQFAGGDAFDGVLFIGDLACLPVWRDLRVSCIPPRLPSVAKLALWGPVEMPIGEVVLPAAELKRERGLAEKENRVFQLNGAPTKALLNAKDLNALIAQVVGSADI